MKNILMMSALCLSGLSLVACGGGSKGSDEPFFKGFGKAAAIQGPDLSGQWISGCEDSVFRSGAKRKIRVKAEGSSIQVSELSFADSTCTTLQRTETIKGTYAFEKQTGSAYLMRITIPINANATTWRYHNVSLENKVLKLTDARIDAEDLDGAAPTIMLTPEAQGQEGSVNPTPAPVPAPVPGFAPLRGRYLNTTAGSTFCSQRVSVMMEAQKLTGLIVVYEGPCYGTTEFSCVGTVCRSAENERITFVSEKSYEYVDLSTGKKALFQLQ